MKSLRYELKESKILLDLTQKVYCLKEEEKKFRDMEKKHLSLPDDVIVSESTGDHFRNIDNDLSNEELNQLFIYRQILYLKSIKNSMTFFVVLAVISLILSLIAISQ